MARLLLLTANAAVATAFGSLTIMLVCLFSAMICVHDDTYTCVSVVYMCAHRIIAESIKKYRDVQK